MSGQVKSTSTLQRAKYDRDGDGDGVLFLSMLPSEVYHHIVNEISLLT